MITIDQLLESVDLDFEPRWVAKDGNGDVYIFEHKPEIYEPSKQWQTTVCASGLAGYEGLKLAEFDGKDWTECIYEVPQKVDPYAEQRKCICKLCWFWNYNKADKVIGILTGVFDEADRPFERNIDQTLYKHCEPVRPDDDVIYKEEHKDKIEIGTLYIDKNVTFSDDDDDDVGVALEDYEVPRKTTGKIEKIPDELNLQIGEYGKTKFDIIPKETFAMVCRKINSLVDAVNELKGAKNE